MPNPGVRFHAWIYAKSPDVAAIVHTHPPACAALSMIGEPLAIAHMDATPLFDDCAYLAEWPGLPIGDDEGSIISEAIGSKHAILLAHHGLLTAGKTIEEATMLAVWMEHAADMQLRATLVRSGPSLPSSPPNRVTFFARRRSSISHSKVLRGESCETTLVWSTKAFSGEGESGSRQENDCKRAAVLI